MRLFFGNCFEHKMVYLELLLFLASKNMITFCSTFFFKFGKTIGRSHGRTDGRKVGRTDERTDVRTDGRTGGRTRGRADGKDGRAGEGGTELTNITHG